MVALCKSTPTKGENSEILVKSFDQIDYDSLKEMLIF
jgi:hypothetical protein